MTLRSQILRHSVFAAALMTAGAAAAAAQQPPPSQPPNAFQGMQVNRDKPIQINATTLEVRDKEKKATFIGNVVVVQGETTMKCKMLDVFYEQNAVAGDAPKPAPAGPGGGQQQIQRLEAKGNVVVIQKEQTATGDNAIYDLKSNSVTLIGNVTVTQGQNVVRGDRIVVDLTTGITRVESGGTGEVSGLFLPNAPKTDPNKAKTDTKADTKTAPKTAPKQGQTQPLKLN